MGELKEHPANHKKANPDQGNRDDGAEFFVGEGVCYFAAKDHAHRLNQPQGDSHAEIDVTIEHKSDGGEHCNGELDGLTYANRSQGHEAEQEEEGDEENWPTCAGQGGAKTNPNADQDQDGFSQGWGSVGGRGAFCESVVTREDDQGR